MMSEKVDAGTSTPIGDIRAKVMTTHGESFSNFKGSGRTFRISSEIEAQTEDRLYATIINYGIYEYPVYEDGKLHSYLTTITPEISQNQWFSTESYTAQGYFPRHEVGCLFSYQSYGGLNGKFDKNLDPTIRSMIHLKLEGDGYQIDKSSSYNWDVDFSNFSESVSSNSNQFSIGAELSYSNEFQLFGQGADLEIAVSGDYSQETTSSFSTSIDRSINLEVQLGSIVSRLDAAYSVTPYFYWAKNGALVIDYSVDLVTAPPNLPNTWWDANYKEKPDLSLILPWRNHPEKAFPLEEEIKRWQSKSITYSSNGKELNPGEVITFHAAVHNYSLMPVEEQVEVAFFLGHPCSPKSKRLQSVEGKVSAFTESLILGRERSLVSFNWRIPEDITNNPRIYVQLDPGQSIDEIHENNNFGWINLDVWRENGRPSDYLKFEEVKDCFFNNQILSTDQLNQVDHHVRFYPNPLQDFATLTFTTRQREKVRLEILTPSGIVIFQPIDEWVGASSHRRSLDFGSLPDGLYLYRLQIGNYLANGKFVVSQ